MITFIENTSRCKIPSSKTNKAGYDPERIERVHRRHRWRRHQISPSVVVNPANRTVAIGYSPAPYPTNLGTNHMVPLGKAHQSGAWSRPAELKKLYANYLADPRHPIAVTASANRSKGSEGPTSVNQITNPIGERRAQRYVQARFKDGACSVPLRLHRNRPNYPALFIQVLEHRLRVFWHWDAFHHAGKFFTGGVNKTPFIGRDAVSVADSNNQL